MGKNQNITHHDADVIAAHNERMILMARAGRDSCRAVPKRERTEYIENQLSYWLNCVSAFKWSSSMARQLAKDTSDGARQQLAATKASIAERSGDRPSQGNGESGQT